MIANKMKLNSEKTEIMLLGTCKQLQEISLKSISVAGTEVPITKGPIHNLGATFDSFLSMEAQVINTVKSASLHLRNIGHVRQRLTTDATKSLVQSAVVARLDYCNSLLCGVPDVLLDRLQRIYNSAARLIKLSRTREHVTPLLASLHWLPVRARIDFKVLLLVYKALHG